MKVLAPILLVVGLAIGSGARLLAPTPEPAPPSTETGGTEEEAQSPSSAEPERVETPPAAKSPTGTPRGEGADTPVDRLERLRRMLASTSAQVPAGDGSIGGIVVAGDDSPLAGFPLRLVPQRAPSGTNSPNENIRARDLERYILDRAAEHRHRDALTREVVSDEEGRFRFDGLPNVPYGIATEEEDVRLMMTVEDDGRRTFSVGDEVTVQVFRPCTVPVAIRLPDGGAPASATLTSGNETHSWTPSEPTIRLHAGRHWLRAEAPGYAEAQRTVSVAEGRTRPIVIDLQRDAGLEVTVVRPAGEENVQVHVRHAAVPAGIEVTPEWLLRHSGRTNYPVQHSPRSGGESASPTQKITPLPPGEYVVGIGRTGEEIDAMVYATVGEGLTPVTVELPSIDPRDVIRVEVLSAAGEPVPATFRLRHVDGWNGDNIDVATVGQAGSYWLRPEAVAWDVLEGARPGSLRLTVDAEGHGRRELEVESTDILVRFAPPATLRLNITGLSEGEDVNVRVHDIDGIQVGRYDLEDLEEPIGPLEAGEVELEVSVQSQTGTESLVDPVWIALAEGENAASIAVPPRFTLTAEFPDGVENREVMLMRADGPVGRDMGMNESLGEKVGDTGRRFAGLLPGLYTLMVADESTMRFEAMEIDLLGDRTVTFSGKPLLSFMVRMRTDADAADMGFLDGDIVIGSDGKKFETFAELMQMMMMLERGTQAKFLVERGGRRIDLEVDARAMERLMGIGARIVPLAGD